MPKAPERQTIRIPYKPNAKQTKFHSSSASECVYGGAKGGGKSCALMMEALAYGLQHAGARIYLFRETYDDLEANLIQEMKEKWPEDLYRYHETSHVATLYNGTMVYFRYVRSYQDAKKYQGRSIDFIGVDELTKHEERSIQELLSCLRSPKGFPPIFRATCNPGGIGHAWVKAKYIVSTNYGLKPTKDPVTGNKIQFIPAMVYDNEVIMKNDPNYVKRLENLPEDQKKAFLYGDWDIFQGQYFPEWRNAPGQDESHVIRPFQIPHYWRKFRSIDWGYNDMCAIYWHTAGDDGHIYTYRELYINQTLASEVARMIVGLSENEQIDYMVASQDMWANRGNEIRKGETTAETFRLHGVPLQKADNTRIIGWNRMREFMSLAPDGRPYWQVFDTCHNLIRTLPEQIHDEKRPEDMAQGEDHCCESIRYFLMSKPSPHTTGFTFPNGKRVYHFDTEAGRDEDEDDEDNFSFYGR